MIGLRQNDPRPLYLQVKESLRDEIAAGRFKLNEPIPDERTLAADLGLSRMTVRRAMVELAEEGYFERIPGRGTFLRAGTPVANATPASPAILTLTLAIVSGFERLDPSDGLFYGRALRGMQNALGDHAQLVLKRLSTPATSFLEQLKATRAADGVIALSITDAQALEAFATCGLPVVFFDCATPMATGNFDIVTHANELGGYQAVSALIEQGHRRIGMFVHGSSNDPATSAIGEVARDRLAGFERALRERGLSVRPEWIRPVVPNSTSAYAATRDMLRLSASELPTALVWTIDEMAAGAIAAAKDAGWRVPEQLSIAGFGDVGVFSVPALATVRMQIERSGEASVRMLLERIANPKLESRRQIMSTEFIARGSIGLPRLEQP